jgi:pSer/pThr/pTyr-binding forkhead associated (FHA) protein
MQLTYTDKGGKQTILQLGTDPVIIGRSEEAALLIHDDKSSRSHCEVRVWDGDYIVKDLRSQNGTYVNGAKITVAQLQPGDEIRIGDTFIRFERQTAVGASTAIREIQDEMDEGKGFGTILREIVHEEEDIETKSGDAEPAE